SGRGPGGFVPPGLGSFRRRSAHAAVARCRIACPDFGGFGDAHTVPGRAGIMSAGGEGSGMADDPKSVLRGGRSRLDAAPALLSDHAAAVAAVHRALTPLRDEAAREQLASVPVERLSVVSTSNAGDG